MKNSLSLTLLLFTGLRIYAQQNQSFALQQVIKLGLEHSNVLKLSQAKVEAANAKYNQAVDATIPLLKLTAGYTRQSDIAEFKTQFPGQPDPVVFYPNIPDNYTSRASLSEIIFSGFRLKYAKASQQFLQKAVLLEAQKDSDEVVFNLVNAFYNLYKVRQSLQIVAENLELVKQHLKDAVNYENNGLVTHNEVLKWQLQQSNVELTKLDLENNSDIANYNMNLLLGLTGDVIIEVDSISVFTPKDLKNLQDYLQLSQNSRGELLSLESRGNALANSLKVAQNSCYPLIAVGANYYFSRPNQRIFPLRDEWNRTWDAGATLTFDITNLYSNKHIVAESKANLRQAEAQISILSDAIKTEVNQSYLSYMESLKKIEVFGQSVLQADENFRITDNKYKNQLVLQSELFDADNALLQTKINLIVSKADAEIAYFKLLKSAGIIQ